MNSMTFTEGDDRRDELQAAVEATRLNFGLTSAEVRDLVRRALSLGARGICVPPTFVAIAVAEISPAGAGNLDIVTVANFPTGDHSLEMVCSQAVAAVAAGADHLDVVVPGGLVADRNWPDVTDFLRKVRTGIDGAAAGTVAMKVILESAAWDADRLRGVAAAAIEAGADWLKTSTGFHPAGGATVECVRLLRALVPDGVGVKASGGIRTRDAALRMLDAGADRIGTSSEAAILREAEAG